MHKHFKPSNLASKPKKRIFSELPAKYKRLSRINHRSYISNIKCTLFNPIELPEVYQNVSQTAFSNPFSVHLFDEVARCWQGPLNTDNFFHNYFPVFLKLLISFIIYNPLKMTPITSHLTAFFMFQRTILS